MFHQPFGFFAYHFRHLHVTLGRLVKGGAHYFSPHIALHIGDFFGSLIDQQDDEVSLLMVNRDGIGNILKQHGLAGARLSDDQAALTETDRGQEIHHPGGKIIGNAFQLDASIRIEGSKVVKKYFISSYFRIFIINRFHL